MNIKPINIHEIQKIKWTSNPKINIKQQTQKNYFKPANLQSINKHIERSSNKSTEMNNPEPISSSLFQSSTNQDPIIFASVIHFINGQIWNATPSLIPPILLDPSTIVNTLSLTTESLNCKDNNDGFRDLISTSSIWAHPFHGFHLFRSAT